MAKKRTPAEKRLRGFMCGDADRVKRTADRTITIADTTVHRHMAANAEAIRAAIAPLNLEDGLADEIEAYLGRMCAQYGTAGFGRAGLPMHGVCQCQSARGNPGSQPSVFTKVSEVVHDGWSEIVVRCRFCDRSRDVTEDVGYHAPQYHWK